MERRSNPQDEAARIASLRSLSILDTPAEERFDRITRLARRVFEVPMALVSLVDERRQWFKSAQGLSVCQTHRDVAFCHYAIQSAETMIVEDTHKDPRFSENPLVTGAPFIRFYAGRPVRSPEGYRVGTLCILDRVPRTLDLGDLAALEDLGALVEGELGLQRLGQVQADLHAELRQAQRQAAIDPLTQTWNRRTILQLLDRELDRARRQDTPVSLAHLELDRFREIRTSHPTETADEVLKEISQRLRRCIRGYDSAGRVGRAEFLLVLPGAHTEAADTVAERIMSALKDRPVRSGERIVPISVSLGLTTWVPGDPRGAEEMLGDADAALNLARSRGVGHHAASPVLRPSSRHVG